MLIYIVIRKEDIYDAVKDIKMINKQKNEKNRANEGENARECVTGRGASGGCIGNGGMK